jgi:hypothetical protein
MVPNKPATRLAGKRSPVRSAKAGAAKRLSKPTATARKPR